MLKTAGFSEVKVEIKEGSRDFIKDWMPGSGAEQFVVSANVTATKPSSGVAAAPAAQAAGGCCPPAPAAGGCCPPAAPAAEGCCPPSAPVKAKKG
mmetsp:Transcript_6949/g.14916  ORF Transcript_6949/g.14916 Transcript_6949/m.14916 type:complete len:95 (-) Transcript_6949:1407-1691(-)